MLIMALISPKLLNNTPRNFWHIKLNQSSIVKPIYGYLLPNLVINCINFIFNAISSYNQLLHMRNLMKFYTMHAYNQLF